MHFTKFFCIFAIGFYFSMIATDINFENQLINEFFNSDSMKPASMKVLTKNEILNHVLNEGKWKEETNPRDIIKAAIDEYNDLISENNKIKVNFEDIYFNDEAFEI